MENKQFEYWKIRVTNPRFPPLAVKNLDAIKINPDVSDVDIIRQLEYWKLHDEPVLDDQHSDDKKRPIEKLKDDEDDGKNQILSPKHAPKPVMEQKLTWYLVNYGQHVPSRKNKQWKFDGYLRVEPDPKDPLKTLCTLCDEEKQSLTSVRLNKPIDVNEDLILGNYDCRICGIVEEFLCK